MKRFLCLYVLAGVLFLAIDMNWLRVFAADFHTAYGHGILLERPVVGVAAFVYLFYPLGLTTFVIYPNLGSGAWLIFGKGLLFGFIVYSIYDLTNLATIADWSVLLSVVDILWGSLLSGSVSLMTFFIFKWFFVE